MKANLISERLTVDDYEQAVELFYERHWTDGLPVVLPTRRRVEALIEHAGRDPQESLGPVPHAIRLALVPHRKGGETADDQRHKAEVALPEIVARLVEPA